MWGIRPGRTMTEIRTFYSRCLFCGVWYPAEQHPAGPDIPPNKVLLVIIPCGTMSCRVSNPGEQLLNTNISANSKQSSKIFYGVNSGTIQRPIHGKNMRLKISCHCPFNYFTNLPFPYTLSHQNFPTYRTLSHLPFSPNPGSMIPSTHRWASLTQNLTR